ncbi:hypothetical protein RY619_002509 [Escherichia coli]|nr:hypothetical protein [Escherichia coli]EER4023997.1 hypothetical protein [Escherichia coli]EEU1516091.1 hypothetical protein [Escherichia coli]EEW3839156.1 hypothetical protein [Escherichia coli]EEW3865891.1 hypothetical protein [Escherichia coli]
MGKNDVNQIADNVRVVHAGCGVSALSGLQSHANSIYCRINVDTDKRSASGNLTLVISDIPITLSMCWREERGKQALAA